MAQDPRTVVKVGVQLWSHQVAIADAGEIAPPHDTAYQFSGGRKFVNPKSYFPANTEPPDNPPDPAP